MNTRRARKQSISKAMHKVYAQPAVGDLSKSQLERRIAELERKLRAREMEVASLQQENIKKESKIKHYSSQVESLSTEVKTFKVINQSLQKRYSQVVQETGYQKFGHFGHVEDYLEGAKPQLVERFLARLHMHFNSEWKSAWDNEVRQKMLTWYYKEIDLFMDDNKLTELYYESGDSVGTITPFSAEEIYEHIMQYVSSNDAGTDISDVE